MGVEPTHTLWKSIRLPLHHTCVKLVAGSGIEPETRRYEHRVLPLHYLAIQNWSIVWELNPRSQLGRLEHGHYANDAFSATVQSFQFLQ